MFETKYGALCWASTAAGVGGGYVESELTWILFNTERR